MLPANRNTPRRLSWFLRRDGQPATKQREGRGRHRRDTTGGGGEGGRERKVDRQRKCKPDAKLPWQVRPRDSHNKKRPVNTNTTTTWGRRGRSSVGPYRHGSCAPPPGACTVPHQEGEINLGLEGEDGKTQEHRHRQSRRLYHDRTLKKKRKKRFTGRGEGGFQARGRRHQPLLLQV